ncbi:MAG: mono/diheme cytochrome c family protein/glucose/arabinose dehydrogenase [Maribacter sp.]|jgi:mono/diheme cytochrome c family protein/glucose/arabinose dehydrogenase
MLNSYKFKIPRFSTDCYAVLLLNLMLTACSSSNEEAIVALDTYQIEEGFNIDLVAAEPLLVAPVALSFDDKGRIWVSEMPGYMANMEGNGQQEPNGNIKILEDLDGDGIMDHTTIFLDSLVLPRALAHVYDGLLYAEPPYLYFTEIENDTPKNRVVVDSMYAAEGNPEHQPNGLVMNIDNWIYSAKSSFRYRRRKGIWIKEPTTFRGQWGISNDDFGRLYYNNNSTQLVGDYVVPNRLTRNEYFAPQFGVRKNLTDNQGVYPLQPTLVNRGYSKGVLDGDSLLLNVTAACSPLVYRGGDFPLDYNQNVFVCLPEINAIKRNILTFHGDSTSAKQAWKGKEFLASMDKGFRPVSLANGPDGSMYVVDMHRGIIQHTAYSSPYYRKKAKASQIDTLVNYGRILKITAESTKKSSFNTDLLKENLLASLVHRNGWIRDRAQQKLIQNHTPSHIPLLENMVMVEEKSLAQLHALYVLEGTNQLSFEFLEKAALCLNPQVVAHALVLLEGFISKDYKEKVLQLFTKLQGRNDTAINLYLASTLGSWAKISQQDFFPLIARLSEKNSNNQILTEALLSGLAGQEEALFDYLKRTDSSGSVFLKVDLLKVMDNKKADNKNRIYTTVYLAEDNRTKGAKIFRQICASCHGINGEGMEGLAPPLIKSEYVSEPVERLALILLHGLSGPVHVNGERYEFNQAMPGLIANETLTDKDIADIISYVTNAFSDKPKGITLEKIQELRSKKSKSGGEYTEAELLELY